MTTGLHDNNGQLHHFSDAGVQTKARTASTMHLPVIMEHLSETFYLLQPCQSWVHCMVGEGWHG